MFEYFLLPATALGCVFFCAKWLEERGKSARRAALWSELAARLEASEFDGATTLARDLHDETALRICRLAAGLAAVGETEGRARRDFEDMLASLQDGVVVLDGQARLRYLNAAALALFALRIEDALGAHVLEALPSFGLDAAVQEALEHGRGGAREVRLYSPRQRDVFLRVAPVRAGDGSVSGAVAILQDLTELRRLERVRRDFVANASHELRTPVATIRASAETILDDVDNAAHVRRFLPPLVAEAERLSRLVSDLLDLARAEAQEDQQREPVDLCAVARGVVDHLADKAAQKQISVSCDCSQPAVITGDASALEQVVFNLLDNALIYSSPGCAVHLRIAAAVPGRVELAVQDNGIGISQKDADRVFERFYRVDKARSRSQGGTGLGLAIVKHIVENHGGFIEVESVEGQGTTFRISLPTE